MVTHYFDPRPNYGSISAHSNNSYNSTSSASTTITTPGTGTANKNNNKKKKQEKSRPIYHQMGMGGLMQTPRSLPYTDFLLPQNNRFGPSATAPLVPQGAVTAAAISDHSHHQEWAPSSSSSSSAAAMVAGASGPLPPPSSYSGFPSFHLRKSQSVGKSNPSKKGIKSRFKKLRQKQGSTSSSRDQLAFITSGESDSEAGIDHEHETTTFNARGMTNRFATRTSDNNTTTTKSRSRNAAALFDTGLPQHPFRSVSFNYNNNNHNIFSGGSTSKKSEAAGGGEHGGTEQQHKEPSAARFKDLFKDVGSGLSGHHHSYSHGHSHSQSMSATGSPVIHPASSPSPSWEHYYPSGGGGAGAGGAPAAGLMKPFQIRGTFPRFGDFLSGDDQPSATSTTRFRIPAPGRRKKKFSKKLNSTGSGSGGGGSGDGYAPAATDDEDSPVPTRSAATMFTGSGRQRHRTQQEEVLVPQRQREHHNHHRFLPHLHYRHRSRSFDEGSCRNVEITWRLPPISSGSAADAAGITNISPALRDARKTNRDPGVLLVELEPLPTKFVHDIAAIKLHHLHQQQQQQQQQQRQNHHHQHHSSTPSQQIYLQSQASGGSGAGGPMNAFLTPSSTMASGFGSISSAPTTHHNSQNSNYYNPQLMTPLQQLQLQEEQQQKQQHNHHHQQAHSKSKANPAAIFCTKPFLFKSYQSSRFRGHYVFRVIGDQIEYKRLPVALEESCSQYFRKADVTYRSLERKAKAIREERDERKRSTSRSQSQPQLLHHQQQQQNQPPLPLSSKISRTRSQELEDFYGSGASEPAVATLSSFLKEGGGLSQGDSSRFLGGGTEKRRSSGHEILKSAVAWDYYDPASSAGTTHMPAEVLSDSSISLSTAGRSFRSRGNSSYLSQRYNPENSNNALVRTFLGGPGSDRLKTDPLAAEMNPHAVSGMISFQSPMATAVMARPPLSRNRKRSWSNIKEEQRRQEEEDEARFKEMERKFREELEQAVYGLELYLNEILRNLEFERFDAAADVRVVNDNRDTAVFSLLNVDGTNIMSLESPSTKLKYEFLNRITMSLMGREEAEGDALPARKSKETRQHLNSFLNMSTGTLRDRSEDGIEDVDLLFEMIDIRLQQQEAKLRSMRENIQSTMAEIDSCLSQLDRLDDKAKKMMTTMITAIDSHEVQLSLRPSPSTGQTLAETVDGKLRDVNERIVVCTRIMGAARQNLNRLKYEIELEQRSIRLFRQYKIIIAVITGSIVFLVWFLYHSRASALAPQPASPLFSTPANPFEDINNFHHGEPPILPSPASTLGFTSSKIVPTPTASVAPPPPHAAVSASASISPSGSAEKDDFADSATDSKTGSEKYNVDGGRSRNSGNSNDDNLIDFVQAHMADLDLQDEFDATIPDHSEL
ncbi:hypothetical protein BGX33_002984 [Mortierella sp. NVP41]|nr:hypothetical protein BGX33_002984 [Mortierella sp. NVP41]